MPSAPKKRITEIYERLSEYFLEVKILPSLDEILKDGNYSKQLKDISVEDLLARHPQDLDKEKISSFIKDKTILITGAGGSIGSEIVRQCIKFGASKLILVEHSEINLYQIEQEIVGQVDFIPVMQSVVNKEVLQKTFQTYTPDIVIHAAAYKHVPLVEANIEEAILNNIIGTKNVIDLSVEYKVSKVVLISTDKAVRPTNVMGTTKRICELYAQNSNAKGVDIVAVRFGNVL
jgi:FlaA1/EpsC-like NDP-sugar epimerase